MIFVDSNVFVINLRYPRDSNAALNARFLTELAARGDGVTSVVNVLEVCGILSFNLNRQQLLALYTYFPQRFGIEVIAARGTAALAPASPMRLFELISKKLSFGDALVALAATEWVDDLEAFISWDASHFQDKVASRVQTPEQALADWIR